MPQPIRRSEKGQALTCIDYDENLDRVMERENHTGFQSANTIYDLYDKVKTYDYITALVECCDDLRLQITTIQDEVFGTGNISTLLANLRNEFNTRIAVIEADIVTLETCCSDLTQADIAIRSSITTLQTNVGTLTQNLNSLISNVYTKAQVDTKIASAIAGGSIDLSGYYTKTEVYNKSEVDTIASGIQAGGGGGSGVDLSNYYTKDGVNTISSGLESSIPNSIYGNPGLDLVISSNASISGSLYINSLTVNSGVTLSVEAGIQIFVKTNVTINGYIIVNPRVPGGAYISGNFRSNDYISYSGQGPGGGSGHGAIAPSYSYTQSNAGSGGASSFFRIWTTDSDGFSAQTGAGGNGGGHFILNALGTITIGGSISCKGGNGSTATYSGNSATDRFLISGPGGGSGGLIWLKSKTSIVISSGAILDVSGGNGGPGFNLDSDTPTLRVYGGGGGGGGYSILTAPTVTNNGTLTIGGGNGGTTANPEGTGGLGGGSGGSFGGSGGGSSATNGNSGQLVLQTYQPVWN